MKNIVILGNGISGITAARHIRKLSDYKITVISAETDHFFSRTALMYIYMGHMKYEHTKPYEDWFWDKNRIDWFVDGKRYHFFDNRNISEKEWPFDQEFHLILNIAVGGNWGGKEGVDDDIWPQKMIVDYVRVWQK